MIILLYVNSCKQNTFSTEEKLIGYLNEDQNRYTQHKSINGYDFTLQYKPTDLLVKQELGDSISNDKIIELRDKYNKYLYFNLSISRNNQELLSSAPKNRNEFGVMVNQLVFGMVEKVHLYTKSKDTLEIADYIYPRMYGMSRATTMLFVFPKQKKALQDDYLNFTIQDLGLYTGEVKFKIETVIIKNQPELSFK